MTDRVPSGLLGVVGPSYAPNPSIELKWRERMQKREASRGLAVELQLPSDPDASVMAVRMPLRALFRNGRIPDPLTEVVQDMIAKIEGADPDAAIESTMQEFNESPIATMNRWIKLLNAVWLGCVSFPAFTDDEGAEGSTEPPFYVGDVDYFDKLYVYQWAQGVDQSVIDFLNEQKSLVGNVAAGGEIPLSPEPLVRIERRGGRVVGVVPGSGGVHMGELHRAESAGDARSSSAAEQSDANDGSPEVQRGNHRVVDSRPAPRARRPKRVAS